MICVVFIYRTYFLQNHLTSTQYSASVPVSVSVFSSRVAVSASVLLTVYSVSVSVSASVVLSISGRLG